VATNIVVGLTLERYVVSTSNLVHWMTTHVASRDTNPRSKGQRRRVT